jgi:hypothetical protein
VQDDADWVDLGSLKEKQHRVTKGQMQRFVSFVVSDVAMEAKKRGRIDGLPVLAEE